MAAIRVLIVDDSAVIRKVLCDALSVDPARRPHPFFALLGS